MRALRLHGPNDLRLDDIPEPSIVPGTVKVQVEWCGICGSDLHMYGVGPLGSAMTGGAHPITGESGPYVLGHEFAGRVVGVGDGVPGLAEGTRVAVEPILYDGTCHWCRRGMYNLCDKMGFVGLDGWGGGLSEYVVLPARMVHALPEGVDTDIGALVEPLSVGWSGMLRSMLRAGGSALVVGAGPVGLAVVLALRAAGMGPVIVSELSATRRQVAADLGADLVLDPGVDDVVARVRRETAGLGAHATFDASGVKATLETALDAVRKRGTVVNLALWEHEVEIAPMALVMSEASYTASLAYNEGMFPAVISCVADGRIAAERMITKRVALEDADEEAFQALLHSRDDDVKILVHP